MEEKFREDVKDIMKDIKITERNEYICEMFRQGKTLSQIETLVRKKFHPEVVCGRENIRLICRKKFGKQYKRGRFVEGGKITKTQTLKMLEESRADTSLWSCIKNIFRKFYNE